MATIMTVDQKAPVTVSFTDRAGNAVTMDGVVPAWTVSDAAILSVVPAADGMSATVDTVGGVGTASVSVEAGAFAGSAEFEIRAGAPVAIAVTVGAPEAR